MKTLSDAQLAGFRMVCREKAARAWAPPDPLCELERLAADPEHTVRYLVAANLHTPQEVLDSLAADAHPMVAWAAARKAGEPPNSRRIPVAVLKHIMRQFIDDDDLCEAAYQFVLLGLFKIDDSGQVWRLGRLQDRRNANGFARLVSVSLRSAEHMPDRRYSSVSVVCRHMFLQLGTHRLVHRAFVGKVPDRYLIHHMDENKQNNLPSNLESMTAAQHHHQHPTRLRRITVLSPDDVRMIKKLLGLGVGCGPIARYYGVCERTVYDIRRGKAWGDVK